MGNDPGEIYPSLQKAVEKEKADFEDKYLWLKQSMPPAFFKEIPEDWLLLIVHSLMGLALQDYFSEIHLKHAAIALCTDRPDADIKVLSHYPFYGIKTYTTYISHLPFPGIGQPLRIGVIYFTEAESKEQESLPKETLDRLTAQLVARNPTLSPQTIRETVLECDPSFLSKLSLERQTIAIELFERAKSRDHCQYEVQYEENWEELGSPSMQVLIAWKTVPKHNFLCRLAQMVDQHKLVMKRVNATYINPDKTNSTLILSFGLHGAKGKGAWEEADIADFLQEMVTLKYFGGADAIDHTFVKSGLIRGNLANLLRTMVTFIHQVLVHADPYLYGIDNLIEGVCRHPELTMKILETFELRFHPIRHDAHKYEQLRQEVLSLVEHLDTGHDYHDTRRKNILYQALNFIHHTLKTNFYRNNKTSFAFRLDPHYLDHAPFEREKYFPELPFAIFFIAGMHFFGFHIRFKDLSRGGLRTIYPEKKERMLAERDTIFTECYNLAYTQNKKNKDIPEGGSKATIFLKPVEQIEFEAEILAKEMAQAEIPAEEIEEKIATFIKEQRLEYLYQTQRSFIKNLLSLINCYPNGTLKAKHIVDYWQRPEYLYLGPDENMTNPMIEWIAQESKKEAYKPGGAFISGKPRLGINHKEYGVTSLGLHVYVDEVLNYLGFDPKHEPFTVKISGGPDGDVAGNEIYNLYRHYPKTAKLIALTDVSGTIYDPKGLNLEQLVELFQRGLSIRHYPAEHLNEGGFLLDRESKREPSPYVQQTLCWRKQPVDQVIADWLSGSEMNALYRNNVHQVVADIFIPCGGRPRTLRESNYRDFLTKTGEPTAKAIVEGANLYLTPWARHFLEEKGVLIIKDSSANKGGVICSSFEILAGLTLSDEQFLEHKPAIVAEVLERVKQLALFEGRLLLREYRENPKQKLTDLSEEISKRINFFTDQLMEYLQTITLTNHPQSPLIQCYLSYCPKTLRTKFQEQLLKEVPDNHKKAIIASHIASRLVYTRGLKWFPTLPDILPIVLEDQSLLSEDFK